MKLSRFFIFLTLFAAGSAALAPSVASAQIPPPRITAPGEVEEFRGVDSLEVRWDEEYGAEKYHIVLARDRKFRRIFFEDRNVAGSFLELANLDYGIYFLRIRSIGDRGKRGDWSETRAFVITPTPPTTITGSIP